MLSLAKRPFHAMHFTLFRSKTYCIDSYGTGKENALKELEGIDNIKQYRSLEEKLKCTFEEKMKNEHIPYFLILIHKIWLPVGLIFSNYRKLYKLPHYTNEHDLDMLVKKFEAPPENSGRRDVKFLAAPPASGKTCVVLPAFLRSAEKEDEFTHYIYIAFHNNHNRIFKASPYIPIDDEDKAYEQGAAFIINCLQQILFDREPNTTSGFNINSNGEENVAEYMKELIAKLAKGGKEPRILLQFDEHRYMCERTGEKNDYGADFSRDAMSSLAMTIRKNAMAIIGENSDSTNIEKKIPVTVVATYTDKPDLPSSPSPCVCRAPVGLPPIDIELVMKVTKLKDEKGNYYYPFHFPIGGKLIVLKKGS